MARPLSTLSEFTGLDDLISDRSDATQHRVGFLRTAKLVGKRFGAHNLTVVAAGISFFLLLALVPTMVAVVSGYALSLGSPEEAAVEIGDLVDRIENTDTRGFLETQLTDVVEDTRGKGTLALIIGIVLALFSISGAVQKLMASISTAYQVHEKRKGLLLRAMAFAFTALLLLLIGVMSAVMGFIPVLLSRADVGTFAEVLINALSAVAAVVIFTMAMTVMYRYGPNRDHRTPWKNKGALAATCLFIIFALALTLFFRFSSLPPSYGLLGSIAVIMIFLQLVALAIVLGAEVNAVLENPANAQNPATAATKVARPAAAVGPRLTARGNPVGGSQPVPAQLAAADLGENLVTDADMDIDAETRGVAADSAEEEKPQMLTFGKALAGLAALFALGRASGG